MGIQPSSPQTSSPQTVQTAQPNRNTRGWAFGLVGVLSLCGAEAATRLAVGKIPESGLEALGRVTLLPYRPTPQAVRDAFDRTLDSSYVVRDPTLGWTLRPGGQAGQYQANGQGVRAEPSRVFDASLPTERRRVVTVGDSFTHGDGVPLADTWQSRLERDRPDLEVINLGVPGYGTDQALLRWRRDGRRFASHDVILGIWPENIARNLNLLRFLMTPGTGLEMSKPRFILEDDELVLLNSPTLDREGLVDALCNAEPRSLLQHEHWLRPEEHHFPPYYHLKVLRVAASVRAAYGRRGLRSRIYSGEDPSGNRVTLAIARAFAAEVETSGARPWVAIFPMRELLPLHGQRGLPLVEQLETAGIQLIDLGPRFVARASETSVSAYYLPDGHLTPAGHQLVADGIAARLERDGAEGQRR